MKRGLLTKFANKFTVNQIWLQKTPGTIRKFDPFYSERSNKPFKSHKLENHANSQRENGDKNNSESGTNFGNAGGIFPWTSLVWNGNFESK